MKQIIQITILLLLLPLVVHAAKWQQITPQQVYNLMEEGSGLWLIDVRETQAFEQTHIEGSVNISPAALATKTFPAKKKLVVTDNALGQLQAQQAAEVLVKNGQKRVYVLSGGVVAWEQAKLPMVGDGLKWPLRQVMAPELAQAQKHDVSFELYDLRGEEVSSANPLDNSTIIRGESFDERLQKLVKQLEKRQKKSMAGKLKAQVVTVVALPAAVDAKMIYQQHFWRLLDDVRVLDGAYLMNQSGQREIRSVGTGCPTCPGG